MWVSEKTDSDRQELIDKYQYVYDRLKEAYSCASLDGKEEIAEIQHEIFEIITELNRKDLLENTAAFKKLKTKVNKANKRLGTLKEEIDKIIKNAAIATKVAKGIDKAFSKAAKFFA
jgi:hypothetical protein